MIHKNASNVIELGFENGKLTIDLCMLKDKVFDLLFEVEDFYKEIYDNK